MTNAFYFLNILSLLAYILLIFSVIVLSKNIFTLFHTHGFQTHFIFFSIKYQFLKTQPVLIKIFYFNWHSFWEYFVELNLH